MKKTIALLNTCEDVEPDVCNEIAKAAQEQQAEFAAAWELTPWEVEYVAKVSDVPDSALRLWILESPDVANALGYHDVDPHGKAYGKAFWGPTRDNGGTLVDSADSLSVTLTHEGVEMRLDEDCEDWWMKPNGSFVAAEPGDPVESDAYPIGDVMVSNYITPAWKMPHAHKGFDRMGTLRAPWSMSPGGYLIVARGGSVHQVFGARYPEWKKALKQHAAARAAKRLKFA